MHSLLPPLGGAGLCLPGKRVFQAGLGASPQSRYSLSLDGTNDYVLAGNVAALSGAAACTVAAWVKTTSVDKEIVSQYQAGGFQFELWQAAAGAAFYIYAGGVTTLRTSAATTNDGTWHHIAGVFSAGAINIYVDGALSNGALTAGPPATLNSVSTSLRIGAEGAAPTDFLAGKIDDVLIVASALTAPQIAALAAGTLDPATLTTSGLWRFEEGTGTTAADSSGNSNAGTLTNGPTWSTDVPSPLQ